jgi:hypothetical protein
LVGLQVLNSGTDSVTPGKKRNTKGKTRMNLGGSIFNLTGLLVASKSVLRYSEGRTKQYGASTLKKVLLKVFEFISRDFRASAPLTEAG